MSISYMSFSFPFPQLTIDNSKSEFEIFSTNFRAINHEPIIDSIENKTELIKATNLSTVLRLIGNDHYKEEEFNFAFQFYNRSIGSAPVDTVEYALALANRSAVFFALKKYKECLKDIDNVLKSKYPENKLLKIYFRQTECFLKLEQNFDALKTWSTATTFVDQCKILPNPVQAEKVQTQILDLIRTHKLYNKEIVEDLNYSKVVLKNGENKKFLNASNAVGLETNNTKGRHVVAKIDIEPGDVLFIEEPYSAVLLNSPDVNCIYCSNCFMFAPANIPCNDCAVRFYCSDKCRQISWEKSHKWECFGERKQLLSSNIRLVLNILFEASHHNFNTFVEDKSRFGNKKNNFAFVNQLVSNKSILTNEEITLCTQYAIYMVIYLKEFTDYFAWLHDKPMYAEKSMSDLYDFIGGVLLKLCMQIYCNCNEIVDVDVFVGESPEIEIDTIGCGLYVSTSMINHSCDPNALISFDKRCKVVRATRKIPKNTEVTVDYIKYRNCNAQTAKEFFLNVYKFKCICAKCNSTRPRNEKIPWICGKCKGKAYSSPDNKSGQCINPECKHIFNINSYRTLELVIGPNLLAATITADQKVIEGTLTIMKKIYHKENVKLAGYYLAAYALYFESLDMKKCVEVSKGFVTFVEQFVEINEMKVRAYLRLTSSLAMHYVKTKIFRLANQECILGELHASIDKTKRLLAFYVPPMAVAKYEKLINTFLEEFN